MTYDPFSAAIADIDCCLGLLGHGVPIRTSLKATDRDLVDLNNRLSNAVGIEQRMASGLVTAWDERAVAALNLIEKAGSVEKVLEVVSDSFGGFASQVQPLLRGGITDALKQEKASVSKSAGITAIFDVVDEEAVDWLDKDTMFWVGNAHTGPLGGKIADVVSQVVVQEGLSTIEAGKLLREGVEPLIRGTRPDHYWTLVARAATTRSRAFGATNALVAAGASNYELINPLDATTSDICRNLNGRIYRVEHAVAVKSAMMNASTPDEARAAAPWPPPSVAHGASTSDLAAKGVALPPFHGNCRTTVIIHTDVGGSVTQDVGDSASEETKTAFEGFAPEEMGNKLRPIVANPEKLQAHFDSTLVQSEIESARVAVSKRDKVIGRVGDGGERLFDFWDKGEGVRATVDEAGLIRSVLVSSKPKDAIASDVASGVALVLQGL